MCRGAKKGEELVSNRSKRREEEDDGGRVAHLELRDDDPGVHRDGHQAPGGGCLPRLLLPKPRVQLPGVKHVAELALPVRAPLLVLGRVVDLVLLEQELVPVANVVGAAGFTSKSE